MPLLEDIDTQLAYADEVRDQGTIAELGFVKDKYGYKSLSEKYWMDRIAAQGVLIYDPVSSTFYRFERGVWFTRTKAEIREMVDAFIRAVVPVGEGIPLDKLLTKKSLDSLVERLAGHHCIVRRDAFANKPHGIVLVANGRLAIAKDGHISFRSDELGRPEDMQTTRLPISYNPDAKPLKTLSWLKRVFTHEEDVNAVAKLLGVCLYGSCRWKKVVVIHGKANMGKSQIPLLAERLVGRSRVSEFETKRLSERFENRRFVGKVLLRAEDVPADFMTSTCAEPIKQLTGFGAMRVEGKNSHEEFDLKGDKIFVMTSNHRLRVKSGVDRTAWEERLVYLEADGESYERNEQDSYFLDSLFEDEEEASGLLNFALEGLQTILEEGYWQRSDVQHDRIKRVLDEGDSVIVWARECLSSAKDDEDRPGVTISEGWASYLRWTEMKELQPWNERTWREIAVETVADVWGKSTSNNLNRNGLVQRGWRGLALSV
jgi:phage/plasmid-associated DNA primase